tara:strand:+ start:27849 stop:28211 length:363 start_codon:yes stop_codon:yes gene_type:complete
MSERLFIGSDGGPFKIRVSKPGFEARNASVLQSLLHEDMKPMSFFAQGYVDVVTGASASVSLGMAFPFPPVVVLRCASNRVCSGSNFNNYNADLNLGNGVLTIFNNLGYTDTFKYVVFIA